MKTEAFVLVAFSIAFCLSYDFVYGDDCSSKAILESGHIKSNSYSDVTKAFSEAASCSSLRRSDNTICCYIKNKFKNEVAGEKYTHKGCIEITYSQYDDIKNTISSFEDSVNNQANITKADISIDCSSKYIKLFGLLLFVLIL